MARARLFATVFLGAAILAASYLLAGPATAALVFGGMTYGGLLASAIAQKG